MVSQRQGVLSLRGSDKLQGNLPSITNYELRVKSMELSLSGKYI